MRRQFTIFGASLLAIVLGMTLVACGTAPAAASNGNVLYAVDSPFLGFDPNVTPAAQDARVLRQVYDNLLGKDGQGKIQPWLATKWTVSADKLAYDFTLRDDVSFQDRTPLDAAAVCFNFKRIADPTTASRYAISLLGPFADCVVKSTDSFTVKLKAPYAPFLSILTSPFLGIASPTAIQKYGKDGFNLHPVGSGPFEFVSYTPNSKIVLKQNPKYNWAPPTAKHSGAAYIKQLTFQIIPDATVRVGSLRSGAVNVIGGVPPNQAGSIKTDPGLKFYAKQQPGAPFQLNLNTTRPVFTDQNVRAAFMKSVDVPTIVKALYFGIYKPASTALSPATTDYAGNVPNPNSYDPKAAAALLDKAGWQVGGDGIRQKDGQRLTVLYIEATPNRDNRQDIATFVQSYARQVGIEVKIQLSQTAQLLPIIQKNDYDVAGLSLVNIDPNVMDSIYDSAYQPTPKKSGFNYTHVTDMDAALRAARAESDPAIRKKMYRDLQEDVLVKAISLPIYVPTYTVATKGVSGLRFDAEAYPIFYDANSGSSNN